MAAVSSPNWLSGMILAEILPATSLQFSSFPEILWPTEYSLSMNSFFCAKQLRVVSVACNKKPKKDTARNDIRRFLHRCKFETHYLNSDNSPTCVSSPLLSSPELIYPKQINTQTPNAFLTSPLGCLKTYKIVPTEFLTFPQNLFLCQISTSKGRVNGTLP